MNNACAYTLLIITLLHPFLLQAMEQKKPGKLKIPALFTQDSAKPVTQPETPQEIPAQYQEECKMLMDAYTHKKKSKQYNPRYECPYLIGGKLLLEAALKNKDTPACVQLLANGALDLHYKQHLLYDALRNGYYPLCHLLLTTKQANVHCEETTRKTPFYWVLAHGHSMQSCDLFALCNLLRQHGADIHKPCKDGRYIYESLAKNISLHNFYKIFPTLRQFGLSLELQDDQGFTPVHRLARSKDANIVSLINLVIPWQVYLERKITLTVLLIQKYRRQSFLGRVPKDVMRKHIMPYVCPFRLRQLDESVNQQLALLQRLLAIKTKLYHTPQDILNVAPLAEQRNNPDLLSPHKVAQHRAAFTDATKKLMQAFDNALK